MLDNLTRRIAGILNGIGRKGKLTEADVTEMLREIRVALLEADVNFKVAKDFIARVKEQAVGEAVFSSLTPDQTIVKIVRDELVAILGEESGKFNYGSQPPTVVLMCGLQGSGKTTTTAKLAKWLVSQGKSPLLAACDRQRPAAITQLQVLGAQIDVPVFVGAEGQSAVSVAKEALERAKYLMKDVLIVDTAGRTQIDETLMAELEQVAKTVKPVETFLVLDSTTGQESVNVAAAFIEKVPVTGVIFTKMDGDTRGGAVLSVRAATGIPVRFTGVGEQIDALEPFYPVRVAERIIGMGDVMGIIEKAEQAFAGENMEDIEKRLGKGSFDFHDMLQTFQMMKKMGPMKNVLKMIPGLGAQIPEEAFDQVNEKDTGRIEAIILSMTHRERSNPDIINGSRRKRIARGSGTSVEDVNRLIKQFHESRRTMKQVAQMQRKSSKFGRFGKR